MSQSSSDSLAYCDMRTLYLRNVPDAVVENLEKLAASAGMSVSRFAVRELERLAQRSDNAALFATLPSFDIDTERIVEMIQEGREGR